MKLNFLQNNRDRLKLILDNINFYPRVVEMKDTYLYEHDGVFVGKMYDLQSKEKKIAIIGTYFEKHEIQYILDKKERLFFIKKQIENFYFRLNIEYDDTSIGGSIGLFNDKKYTFNSLLWGCMFEFILRDFYDYEIKNYRFCTLDEEEVEKITTPAVRRIFPSYVRIAACSRRINN